MLTDTLDSLRARLQANHISGLNERNTEMFFVAPILEAIGWDLHNLGEALAEYSVKGLEQGAEVTCALFHNNEPILLVEVRPLFSNLNQIQGLTRVLKTAKESPARFLAICNGVEWHIYNVENNSSELVLIIDIRDKDAADKLKLLSKSSLKERLLDNYIEEQVPTNINLGSKKASILKARGYRVTDETHQRLTRFRNKIMTSRNVKDQEISNSVILESLLEVFFDAIEYFDFDEISNEIILKRRIEETFKRRFRDPRS